MEKWAEFLRSVQEDRRVEVLLIIDKVESLTDAEYRYLYDVAWPTDYPTAEKIMMGEFDRYGR